MVAVMLVGGLVAGAVSAIAGGSSFLTFPMLIAAGLSPLAANITNWVALTPSNVAALAAYRTELKEIRQNDPNLRLHLAVAFAGGLTGAALLLWSGEATFARAIPWLMLIATLLFAAGPRLGAWLLALRRPGARISPSGPLLLEFLMMVYGGYFGAGLGIMLLAVFAILGETSIHRANARKNLLVGVMSVSVVGVYLASGHVHWLYVIPLFLGSLAGGYWGVRLSRHVSERAIRRAVLAWAGLLTAFMFWRYG